MQYTDMCRARLVAEGAVLSGGGERGIGRDRASHALMASSTFSGPTRTAGGVSALNWSTVTDTVGATVPELHCPFAPNCTLGVAGPSDVMLTPDACKKQQFVNVPHRHVSVFGRAGSTLNDQKLQSSLAEHTAQQSLALAAPRGPLPSAYSALLYTWPGASAVQRMR